MIVRIASDAQYRLDDGLRARLHDLDDRVEKAVQANNVGEFHRLYGEMVSFVKDNGKVVDHEELVSSDLILPTLDLTFDDAKKLFAEA
jgi:hypothetical protein